MATIIRLNQSITDESAPRIRRIITSDDFAGAGELVGTMTTAALGGQPMGWEGASEGFTRADGVLHTPTAPGRRASLLGLPANIAATYRVVSLPSNGRLLLSLRGNDDFTNRVIMRLEHDGTLSIEESIDMTTQSLASTTGVRVGDRLTFVADGATLTANINGEPAVTAVTTVNSPGELRLSTYPAIVASIDDLIVETV